MLRVTCAFLVLTTCQAFTGNGFWQYGDNPDATCKTDKTDATNDRCGPGQWAKVFPKCAEADTQSPIDAVSSNPTHKTGSAITDLSLTSGDCSAVELIVNQHTFEVELGVTCPDVFAAHWMGTRYDLNQFHYHSPNKALEETCKTATTVECNRAKFFQSVLRGKTPAKTLEEAKAAFSDAKFQDSSATTVESLAIKSVDPYNNFIPAMDKYFYHYLGSFTTPDCTTQVPWILNPTPVTIFDSDLTWYREVINVYPKTQVNLDVAQKFAWATDIPEFTWDTKLGTNNRPIQPRVARTFYYVGVLPPWDSSASLDSSDSSGSSDSLDSITSLSRSSESDSSNSWESSGSYASGSSGFYMAVWKWLIVTSLLLCCLIAALAALCKKKPKKPSPKPAPPPQPEPVTTVVEPLMAPMMPMTTAVPMTTAMPMTYEYAAAPVMSTYAAAPVMSTYAAAPMMSPYAAPAAVV